MQTRRLFRVTQVTEGTSANVSRTPDIKWKWNILPKLKNLFFCLLSHNKFPGSD